MNLFNTLSSLEQDDSIHLGRILVLLKAFSGKKGEEFVAGLTKLAKLDFLLRYPTYLEKALTARGARPGLALVKEYERRSIESNMVRFRFGPWDFRYRRFINILIAKGLVWVKVDGRTIKVGLTERGLELANRLASEQAFSDTALRAKVLKQHFDLGATNLMKFIYATFPEISTMRYGEEIDNER